MEEFYSKVRYNIFINISFWVIVITSFFIFVILYLSNEFKSENAIAYYSCLFISIIVEIIALVGLVYKRVTSGITTIVENNSVKIYRPYIRNFINGKIENVMEVSAMEFDAHTSEARCSLKINNIKSVHRVQQKEIIELKNTLKRMENFVYSKNNIIEIYVKKLDMFLMSSPLSLTRARPDKFENHKLYVSVQNPDKFVELINKKIRKK